MIFHEYSLIFFTVLAQTAVGGYLLVSARALTQGYTLAKINRVKIPMFALWALMGLGFLFSTTHLGSPLRAFNAFNQLGSAWLSNEVFFGAAFFAVGGTQWLLSALNRGSLGLQKALMVIAMLLGAIFMYSMVKVYMINTVPTWFNIYTPLSFLMTMAVAGLLLFQLVISASKDINAATSKEIALIALLVVIASLFVTIGKADLITNIQTSAFNAIELVEGVSFYFSAQIVLLIAGFAVWVLPLFTPLSIKPTSQLTLALVLVLSSELIGRGLFYSLHMTVGL